MRSRLSKSVLFKIFNFQEMKKNEILHTKTLRTLQKITICKSVGCEILNKIAKQLLKILNKCILFVSN